MDSRDYRINTLLLNTRQAMHVSQSEIPRALLSAAESAVKHGSGVIVNRVGDCVLHVNTVTGGALMRLATDRCSVGIAFMACWAGLQSFLWEETLRVCHSIEPGFDTFGGCENLKCPPLPWASVILWPNFLRGADVHQAYDAERTLWAAAHVCIARSRLGEEMQGLPHGNALNACTGRFNAPLCWQAGVTENEAGEPGKDMRRVLGTKGE